MTRNARPALVKTQLLRKGIMDEMRSELTRFLEECRAQGAFSAATCAVASPGRASVVAHVGTLGPKDSTDVDELTVFDIASLTKVFVASAAFRLIEAGLLRLEGPAGELCGSLRDPRLRAATLEQILAHEAGFEAWAPLFEAVPLDDRGTSSGRQAILSAVAKTPAGGSPGEGAVYSDLGFIVLGVVLEEVCGVGLEEVVRRYVTEPLGLSSVRYVPLKRADRQGAAFGGDVAVTERCPWRGRFLAGEVHDDNAWAMGGVAGHAGLFATAADVACLGLAWLDSLREGRFIGRALARRALTTRPGGRYLGWDGKSDPDSSAGTLFSPSSFGHLGFTGCSLWVDPVRELSVALLTNRVCYGRDNLLIRSVRPRFHDLVAGLWDKGE